MPEYRYELIAAGAGYRIYDAAGQCVEIGMPGTRAAATARAARQAIRVLEETTAIWHIVHDQHYPADGRKYARPRRKRA
jgi:hypothetical protein